MADFNQNHWALLDLQYEYLDDGFKLTAITDVPCHLYCRMTTTPPQKHSIPSFERGLYLTGDIRFCFVVYEDNEQDEAGDTLTHTWNKTGWPVCETRWFYFVGTQGGAPSVSETAIFKFHFPAPPPEPPPPLTRLFLAQANNRTIRSNSIVWPACRAGAALIVGPWHGAPIYRLISAAWLTASYWITRSFLTFDTSAMPDTARLVSASLYPYAEIANRTSSAAHPHIQLTKGHQSDPVVVGDWFPQNNEGLVLGEIDIESIVTGRYNPIALNQHGLDHINPSGLTRLCIRQEMDVVDFVPPLGTNEFAYYSVQKGIGYRPYLEVFYYPA